MYCRVATRDSTCTFYSEEVTVNQTGSTNWDSQICYLWVSVCVSVSQICIFHNVYKLLFVCAQCINRFRIHNLLISTVLIINCSFMAHSYPITVIITLNRPFKSLCYSVQLITLMLQFLFGKGLLILSKPRGSDWHRGVKYHYWWRPDNKRHYIWIYVWLFFSGSGVQRLMIFSLLFSQTVFWSVLLHHTQTQQQPANATADLLYLKHCKNRLGK